MKPLCLYIWVIPCKMWHFSVSYIFHVRSFICQGNTWGMSQNRHSYVDIGVVYTKTMKTFG